MHSTKKKILIVNFLGIALVFIKSVDLVLVLGCASLDLETDGLEDIATLYCNTSYIISLEEIFSCDASSIAGQIALIQFETGLFYNPWGFTSVIQTWLLQILIRSLKNLNISEKASSDLISWK